MTQSIGADIEIVERSPAGRSAIRGVVMPNEVRINGQAILVPASTTIKVHEICDGEPVSVSITLFAKSLTIRREDDQRGDTTCASTSATSPSTSPPTSTDAPSA